MKEPDMKTRLIVVGAGGRMGCRIIALTAESTDLELVGAVEAAGHPGLGKDAGSLAGVRPLGVTVQDQYHGQKADVVIDFSVAQAAEKTLSYCAASGSALVLGTTGLAPEHRNLIHTAAQKIPIVQATNMSVGMNVLFEMVGKMAALLGPDYDIEIIEEHHRFKKDAPSGSALTLAEQICKETGRRFPDCLVHGREGKEALRAPGTIGMHALRAGDITGVHSVMFSTLGETVTLNHTAHSRDTLARGALRAARWLVSQKSGLYSMRHVLGLA
jgi:4-hydroxy-tetrahydrodipicolinate reductase